MQACNHFTDLGASLQAGANIRPADFGLPSLTCCELHLLVYLSPKLLPRKKKKKKKKSLQVWELSASLHKIDHWCSINLWDTNTYETDKHGLNSSEFEHPIKENILLRNKAANKIQKNGAFIIIQNRNTS